MYILIPPSEGKNPYSNKEYFSLDSLSYKSLNVIRSEIINYLSDNKITKENYIKTFGISSRNYEKINKMNSGIKTSEVIPSISRYTGVLYDFIDYQSLDEKVKNLLHDSIIIFSGLFGLLRPLDKIPNYKLKMGTKLLNGIKLSKFWKNQITSVLQNELENQIVCNLLPTEFNSAFDSKVINLNYELKFSFFQENNDGEFKSITHWTKALRGSLVRYLLNEVGDFNSTDEILSVSQLFTNNNEYEFSKQLSKFNKKKCEIIYIKKYKS